MTPIRGLHALLRTKVVTESSYFTFPAASGPETMRQCTSHLSDERNAPIVSPDSSGTNTAWHGPQNLTHATVIFSMIWTILFTVTGGVASETQCTDVPVNRNPNSDWKFNSSVIVPVTGSCYPPQKQSIKAQSHHQCRTSRKHVEK